MRKFTKEHNELAWLFPLVTEYSTPEKTFDELEQYGNNLLNLGHGNQETFTRDDIMDAFMKGASVMNQILAERIALAKNIQNEIAAIEAI